MQWLNQLPSREMMYYVLCSVSVIPLQHRSCSVCMSFVRLGYHKG